METEGNERTVVVEELLDEVNVGEDHSTAAVALEVEFCERLAFGAAVEEEGEIGVPLVANDFAAGEATDGDDHRGKDVLGEDERRDVGESREVRRRRVDVSLGRFLVEMRDQR